MKKFLTLVLLVIVSTSAFAGEWVSPIDKKYLAKDPELFAKFDRAREISNSWSGQREKLRRVDTLLREILIKDREYAPAFREYGRLFIMAGYINNDNFKAGSLNPAESSILKSIEIEPQYADSYVLLGHLYTQMKRFNEAEKALIKAEEIGTDIPWLHLNWADLLKKQRKYEEALKRFQFIVLKKKGTSNRKAYLSALEGVANIYTSMEEYELANESYKKQIEYAPDNAWCWGNYSDFLLFRYNDVDGAIMKGEKAISKMNYGMGRFVLACAYYTKWALLSKNSNDKQEAQSYFDKAWSIYPYPEKVIETTRMFRSTKITAIALEKWLKINKPKRES